MPDTNPLLTLNNGVEMPALGLGVFQLSPADTLTAVQVALDGGYRLIDTAAAYQNEEQVGEAIRSSDVDRAEVFVTTKLWISDYGRGRHGLDRSLRNLGVDQLDLWLLHQPVPTQFERTIEAWQTAAQLLAEGKVRAIGVSNFSVELLDRLISATDVVPAVNQVELHPYFTQPELREAHDRLGIVTQAWSPIGGVNRYWPGGDAVGDPMSDPVVTGLADRYGKTPAQVMLRWQLQLGHCIIPKSVRAERIAENADIFGFELDADEMASIEALDAGVRGGPDPASITPETFGLDLDA
jgi:diketogulonate reductase-like aldo/keto reductase